MLRNIDPLWSALGPTYFRIIDPFGRGIRIKLGGHVSVTIPSRFSGGELETYEPETFEALAAWMHRNPGARIVDIGCAIGAFSVATLFTDPLAEVIAIDSNVASLRITQEMCSHAVGERLILLYGLVSNEPGGTFAVAQSQTISALATVTRRQAYKDRYKYICMNSCDTAYIPRLRLDDLFPHHQSRPTLIKCDVEGAEHLVIDGAMELLARDKPALLLSVHPSMLQETYNHSADRLRDTISRLGYEIELLAVDHEEHWLCM
jgi:FkbM family methyltransferase